MTKQVFGHLPKIRLFVQFREVWMALPDSFFSQLKAYLWKQIVAVVISLEAEVTETRQICPDAPVNKKRIKNGKVPLYSYHILNISQRFKRPVSTDGSSEYKGVVRLHFRRGHRRHYSTYSRWIKWMLVGNPDLGFVEKHYQLKD
jgi:hypothetical protein